MTELATLKDIPILTAGTHRSRNAGGITITEADLDETLQGSNELAQLMQGGYIPDIFKTGKLSRKMPGPLNLLHDDILDDTIRERVKDVKRSFALENGWLTETFENVPQDVAKAVKHKFPLRSVDLIPWTNPETQKVYKNVVVSTAFLDRLTRPAVSGQSEDIQVELAEGESPVITLYSVEPTTTQEEQGMAENTQAKPETGKDVDVKELTGALSEKDKIIAELQAEKDKEAAKIAELEAARQKDAEQVAELMRKQDAAEVREFLSGFKNQRLHANGVDYVLAPAFVELAAPIIEGVKSSDMIEMSGEQKPARDELKATLQKIAELAAVGGIVAAVGQIGTVGNNTKTTKNEASQIQELMEADKTLSAYDAWLKVQNSKEDK